MVDHIYGRLSLPLAGSRPHMFLKELDLNLDGLKDEVAKLRANLEAKSPDLEGVRENLMTGIRHYGELASRLVADQREEFSSRLEKLKASLETVSLKRPTL